jgi:hypothetical protein
MPLNKLENFIKNAEGRILYVNPNDLDSTDGIENQGNSLTKPFKTIQRALLESARFSYLRGDDNDITEKTTILVFPGEHLIDNRPGYAIKDVANNAIAVAPNGAEFAAQNELTLTLNSNFDLTQENNILYKFNSINGGIIIPRGTSIVGLDLRKTKVRPKYVPNPTDSNVPSSAIFRITGACYFWQFTFFDGDETGLVYTDPSDFSINNRSKPTFSHHKITCFEYADGVNIPGGYQLTDLDMYYSKVGNAFNRASGREIDQKYPAQPNSFAKQRPEWEIVGAFASDPITISNIISGDGSTPSNVVTVTTQSEHNLNAGTPVKIKGINVPDYNISTKVVSVLNERKFTYSLPSVRANLPAGSPAGLSPGSNAAVVIETDTVSGASPYIFNCSLRSVYGMQGMHADGSKADGFRSMVVAQFTAVSLQKDDRAFVKYDPSNRRWNGIGYKRKTGESLSQESSSTSDATVFHLDSDAVYRDEWATTHIKMSNDAVIQIVSVFAIGFHKHFECESGGDASITNSNSNFGQFSLAADGFKREAFDKDDKGYLTGVVTPRSIGASEVDIDWLQFDPHVTGGNTTTRLYLKGYTNALEKPPIIAQGYRIGAKVNDKIFLRAPNVADKEARVLMTEEIPTSTTSNSVTGSDTSVKLYADVQLIQKNGQTVYKTNGAHKLRNGESIRIFSETGDLPEGLEGNKVYYAITKNDASNLIPLNNDEIRIASSNTNANLADPISIKSYGGVQLRIESRVSDKTAGEIGHPIQFDYNVVRSDGGTGNWFIYVDSTGNTIKPHLDTIPTTVEESEITTIKRIEDGRSIDEKIYKFRYVVPKELNNARDPVTGFALQDSGTVNVRDASDFNITTLTGNDYDFNRNPRFISSCTYSNPTNTITIEADKSHGLRQGNIVVLDNIPSSTNTLSRDNFGFNGTFEVSSVVDEHTFTVADVDIFGVTHVPGTPLFNTQVRDKNLPRFSRNDTKENHYIYRVEVVSPFIKDVQDGVYYLYVLNANNGIVQPDGEFSTFKYSQNIADLYPQLDRDNDSDDPPAAASFAKRSPLGEVSTNDLKRSLTKETVDTFFNTYSLGNEIIAVTDNGNNTKTLTLKYEHGLAGIHGSSSATGSGHVEGTYYNVKLFNDFSDPSVAVWDGARADVTVDNLGRVSEYKIVEHGSGYVPNETLYFDTTVIGGTTSSNSAHIDIGESNISMGNKDYVQITGIGTATGGYYRIDNDRDLLGNKKQIVIETHSSDPEIVPGEYVNVLGRVVEVHDAPLSSDRGLVTITTSSPNDLIKGNTIRILKSNEENLGDYLVESVAKNSTNSTRWDIVVNTTVDLHEASRILKHGLSHNNASADSRGENIGTRLHTFYDNEQMEVGGSTEIDISQTEIPFVHTNPYYMTSRFPIGCYIQIGNEIMRVSSSTITNDKLKVIRGVMGTNVERHPVKTVIKKIKLLPIELRRPSILRASGHTFEYLGYGPGNYSTGLPQVQVKTLSENEEFLSQSQETACGTVLYTGMDSDGDFYIGNTKYSAQSGEQKTFDVPIPTITGQDPNRLSVVFDEIIVKDRILVEGGKSKQLLSQFDGPVTFTGDVRFNQTLKLTNVKSIRTNGTVDIGSEADAGDCSDPNAALRVKGGVSIEKKLHVCKEVTIGKSLGPLPAVTTDKALDVLNGYVHIHNTTQASGGSSGALIVEGGATINGGSYGLTVTGGKSRLYKTVEFGSLPSDTDLEVGLEPLSDASDSGGHGVSIGTPSKAFAEAHIGRIQIGHYDSANPGDNGNQHITTRSGELKLDAKNGRVEILKVPSDELIVTGTTNLNGNTSITGTLSASSDATFGGNLDIGGDLETAFVRIDGRTIEPKSGNLSIGSNSSNTQVKGDLTVASAANFAGNTVQITSNKVKATTFQGTADIANAANQVKVFGPSNGGGEGYLVVVDGAGASKNLEMHTNARFNGTTITLGNQSAPPVKLNCEVNNTPGSIEITGHLKCQRVFATNDITAFYSSDERLKDNISKIEDPLAKVVSLGGYTFDWNEKTDNDGTETGVIAQEVESLGLPGIVTTRDDGYKAVRYEKLVPLLIEAIKELNDKVSSLEDKLNN